jgi:hypothetical protein
MTPNVPSKLSPNKLVGGYFSGPTTVAENENPPRFMLCPRRFSRNGPKASKRGTEVIVTRLQLDEVSREKFTNILLT